MKTTWNLGDDARRAALARAEAGELLGPADLGAIFGFGNSVFHQREARGDFNRFKVKPAIGQRRFSGRLVHRYMNGEDVVASAPTFGRKRSA